MQRRSVNPFGVQQPNDLENTNGVHAPLIIDTYSPEEDEFPDTKPKGEFVAPVESIGQADSRAQWQYVISSLAIAALLVCCVLLAVGVFTTTTGYYQHAGFCFILTNILF